LQGRRFTTDDISLTQEAFTSVLDINASEIFTDNRYIPTGSTQLRFSGSSQNALLVSASVVDPSISIDLPILKYWYRKKLRPGGPAGGQKEVYYFTTSDPTTPSDYAGSDQLLETDQLTNFISAKYISKPADTANSAESTTPGYKIVISTGSNAAAAAVVNEVNYVFDYKTGVLTWLPGRNPLAANATDYVFASIYQYVGRTLSSQIVDGTIGGGVDIANLQATASSLVAASASFASLIYNLSSSVATEINDLQAFSASVVTEIDALQSFSSSIAVEINDLQSFSSSVAIEINDLQSFSSSVAIEINDLQNFSSSVAVEINDLQSASSSIAIEINELQAASASFAANYLLNTTDQFDGTLTVNGQLIVNGSPGSVRIDGDLVVNGTTTTINSTNILVDDPFILLASGSAAANVDSGIIATSGSLEGTGSALYHDSTDQRWAVAKSITSATTTVTPLSYVVTVTNVAGSTPPTDADAKYGKGEMRIDDNDIWIYG
jgi:hypothetical protein